MILYWGGHRPNVKNYCSSLHCTKFGHVILLTCFPHVLPDNGVQIEQGSESMPGQLAVVVRGCRFVLPLCLQWSAHLLYKYLNVVVRREGTVCICEKKTGTGCPWVSLLISMGHSFVKLYSENNNIKHPLSLLEYRTRYDMWKHLVSITHVNVLFKWMDLLFPRRPWVVEYCSAIQKTWTFIRNFP